MLTKTTGTDYDTSWQTPAAGGGTTPAFRFVQAAVATTWTISHGLPYYPNVEVVDSAGRRIEPDIVYTSATVITLTFTPAVAGEAYLS